MKTTRGKANSFPTQRGCGAPRKPSAMPTWDDSSKNVGLHLSPRATNVADVGFVATRNFDAALVVSAVTPGSAAERAGLAVGDTILEINGQKADRGFAAGSKIR